METLGWELQLIFITLLKFVGNWFFSNDRSAMYGRVQKLNFSSNKYFQALRTIKN
jgi:hypothetical protein